MSEMAKKIGSIQKVTMINFMTYKNVTITPGNGFNVILGPNGSGKSTLVNAITIGN